MPGAARPSLRLSPGNTDGQCPTGSARGEVGTAGSLAEIAAETPDSAETPPARMLPGTPFPGPAGRDWEPRPIHHCQAPGPAWLRPLPPHQQEQRGPRAAPGQTEVPCQTHAGLLLGSRSRTRPLLSKPQLDGGPAATGVRSQARPLHRAGDVAFTRDSSWQPVSAHPLSARAQGALAWAQSLCDPAQLWAGPGAGGPGAGGPGGRCSHTGLCPAPLLGPHTVAVVRICTHVSTQSCCKSLHLFVHLLASVRPPAWRASHPTHSSQLGPHSLVLRARGCELSHQGHPCPPGLRGEGRGCPGPGRGLSLLPVGWLPRPTVPRGEACAKHGCSWAAVMGGLVFLPHQGQPPQGQRSLGTASLSPQVTLYGSQVDHAAGEGREDPPAAPARELTATLLETHMGTLRPHSVHCAHVVVGKLRHAASQDSRCHPTMRCGG